MTAPFRIVPLGKQDRSAFTCGVEPLDRYFRQQVSQDIRRRVAACYVALERGTDRIVGYFTLSGRHVVLDQLPEALVRRLPRYPSVPAVLLGRLAVTADFQGQGLGGALLADAALRSLEAGIAAYALLVEAKDDRGEAFYRHHGFIPLGGEDCTLFLPLDRIARRLGR